MENNGIIIKKYRVLSYFLYKYVYLLYYGYKISYTLNLNSILFLRKSCMNINPKSLYSPVIHVYDRITIGAL